MFRSLFSSGFSGVGTNPTERVTRRGSIKGSKDEFMRDISAGGSVNRSAIMRVSRPEIFHSSKIKPRGWLLCGGEVAAAMTGKRTT